VLRNLIATANSQQQPAYINYVALNRIMQNVQADQYSFDAVKRAYDTDAAFKSIIKNFDREGITLKTDVTTPSTTAAQAPKKNSVDRMAQQALKKRSK
jgi:hypothetical protein